MIKSSTRFAHYPNLEIVTGMNVCRNFPRHIHDSFCIGLVEHGARIITTQDDETLISPGEMFILNPQQPHSCQSIGTGISYSVISIRPEVMSAFGGAHDPAWRQPFFRTVRIVNDQLAVAIRALCKLVELKYDPCEIETQVVLLLAKLVADYGDCQPANLMPDLQSAVIHRVRKYIDSGYSEKISLSELADACNLSPYHLQRTFVELTGLSPHDYLVYVRIKHSKRLLRQGLPLADIAQDVGFVDQSHFTHSFKRVVGITPGFFANQQ